VLTWLDPSGEALRQETPFGWSLERCTADEAFATLRQSRDSPDMLAGMAVKVEGTIRDARHCESLTLRLVGVPFQREELQTPRQEVLRLDGDVAELRVRRETEAGRSDPAPAPELLQATPALPSDHSEIAGLAASITASCRTPAEKARAIHDWVFEHLEKSMTVSLPSALDVLRSRKGDCNEHTYLAVALARAAGLPARIMVGIAYHEGRFYYHAWPAMYTGQWVESDPTWGQPAVDASHLALVQGELPAQMKLLRIFGQLRVTVLDEAPAGGRTEVSRD
jgi:transglutaminase-like putative cysteine protease